MPFKRMMKSLGKRMTGGGKKSPPKSGGSKPEDTKVTIGKPKSGAPKPEDKKMTIGKPKSSGAATMVSEPKKRGEAPSGGAWGAIKKATGPMGKLMGSAAKAAGGERKKSPLAATADIKDGKVSVSRGKRK
jgi:hypothetical protein